MLILLATPIPIMVFSGGCVMFHVWATRGDCCNTLVVERPSQNEPPQATLGGRPMARMIMLLAVVIAALVLIGGCKGPSLSTCCSAEIVDDASYRNPPYNTLWKWFVKKSRPEAKGESKLPEAYLSELDTNSIGVSLHKQLRDDPRATPTSFFSSLGMSCASTGFDIQCERILPVVYACVHKEPEPRDYAFRREGSLRIVVLVSSSGNAIRSATVAGNPALKPWC